MCRPNARKYFTDNKICLQTIATGMWTILETILLGIIFLYSTVSPHNFNYSFPPSLRVVAGRPPLSAGHLIAVHDRALVPGDWLHYLLRRHRPEALPAPGRVPDPEGPPICCPRPGPAALFVCDDCCCSVLFSCIYRLVYRLSRA